MNHGRLEISHTSEGTLLRLGRRQLVANQSAASVARGSDTAISPGVRSLIRSFLDFYFWDEGELSKNINYCRLVLPERYQTLPSAPRSVSFLITKICNMKCLHCYNDSGLAEPDELGHEDRLRIAHYMGRWGVRVVTITGGEPLLNRDTVPVIRILGKYGVHVKVSTNGWYLSPEFLELVESGLVFQVNVSLDGALAETHDTFRKSPGSYQRVLAALAALRAANVRILNLNVSVHPRSLGELEGICQVAQRFGANSVSLKPVLMTARAVAEPDAILSMVDVQQFRSLRDQLRKKYGNLFHLSGTLVGACLSQDEEDGINCFAAETAMFIASNGDLLPCENLHPFLDVPNAQDYPPLEAWLTHSSFTNYRELTTELRKARRGCSGCPAVGLQRHPSPIPLKQQASSRVQIT